MISTRMMLNRASKIAPVFMAALIAVLGIGLLLIFLLPDIYESRAQITIERSDTAIVGSEDTDQELLTQRMQIIISKALGRESIAALLQQHALVDSRIDSLEYNKAISSFLDAATIETKNASVVNPYTGKMGLIPFGIDVAYRAENPALALAVVKSLVDRVIQANRGQTKLTTDDTSSFLLAELAGREQALQKIEQNIADFRQENSRFLPELYPVAVRRLEDLDRQIQSSRTRLFDLRQDREVVTAELATSSPDALMFASDGTRVQSINERLELLRIDYSIARGKYTADHPQLLRLSNEIRALERAGDSNDTSETERRLAGAQQDLVAARKRYTPDHPDTIKLARLVRSLELELKNASKRAAKAGPQATSIPSSPAYNRLLVKQRAVNDAVAEDERRQRALIESIDTINTQIAAMPQIKQRLMELERQRDAEKVAYEELVSRVTGARLNAGLRQASLLERLTVLEPPVQPMLPIAPKRPLLIAVLLMLALAFATTLALWRDWQRDALWTPEDIKALVQTDVELIARFS